MHSENNLKLHNMENTLKKTALNAMHYEMGAKMVPFAGFDMPVQCSLFQCVFHSITYKN